MKVLKAAICLLLTTFIILLPLGTRTAFADELQAELTQQKYAYADLGSEVYFYSAKNEESSLFIIPQTYCVEILGTDSGWYYVKYAEDDGLYRALYGYCRMQDVVPIDTPLENLYLRMTVTVTYTTDSPNNMIPPLENIEIPSAYYGAFTVGTTSCSYVLCGENFGYIPGSVINYPLNQLPSTDTLGPADPTPVNTTFITAIVITGVAVAAIAILYFTGRNTRKPNA